MENVVYLAGGRDCKLHDSTTVARSCTVYLFAVSAIRLTAKQNCS